MRFLIPLLLLTGCANVSTTTLVFTSTDGSQFSIEMPKELEAKNLQFHVNAKEGIAVLKVDNISTANTGTIKAQGEREGNIAESVSKGVTEGAIEGIKSSHGIP